MKLSDILYKVRLQQVAGSTNKNINALQLDSRKVLANDLFAALKGVQVDGHQFIDTAVRKGATAILCETLPANLQEGITYLQVPNAAAALSICAENFYGNPSSKLKLVGITGTNGKTSIATLLFRMFRGLKYNVGLFSTIKYQINGEVFPASHTTPNAINISRMLAKMVDEGCEYCFMEVSSHGVSQHRVDALQFAGGVFTNMSRDHLDYHGDFKSYIEAKKGFFDMLPKEAFALANIDDKRGRIMLQNTKANQQTYALKSMADFKAKILENSFTGLMLNMDGEEVHSLLIGEFSAYNLLAVYGTAILLGEEKIEVLIELSKLQTAEGRFDPITNSSKSVVGIVDYAHTPDALEKVLETINVIRTKNETLISIVGCAGDRDKGKRPMMAAIACKLSDKVILTSDNPRTENPDAILKDMKEGVSPSAINKTLLITNRREAIRTACMLAKKGDIILLAGKGHEPYQEIHGVKYPFSDKEELQKGLDELLNG